MEYKRYELHFAPLQGYTDHIFRNTFERYFGGIDVWYTPFIRVEKGGFRKRDIRDIAKEVNTVGYLIPQILPGTREEFRKLTDMLCENGYRVADINLGCPFPPIAGKRKGAGMLPYPDLVEEMLGTIEEYPEMRFSVKMRLGWESVDECVVLCDLLNSLRLDHITLHARTGKQQYKGDTWLDAFTCFYECSRQPLFYNGDLCSVEDIRRILDRFPLLRGVSLGRGLLASPFIGKEFKENRTFLEQQRMSVCFSFHESIFSSYAGVLQGDTQLLLKMKSMWEYFLPGTDRKLLKRIRKATKLSQYTEVVGNIWKNEVGR